VVEGAFVVGDGERDKTDGPSAERYLYLYLSIVPR
jgi:hypothetical protein